MASVARRISRDQERRRRRGRRAVRFLKDEDVATVGELSGEALLRARHAGYLPLADDQGDVERGWLMSRLDQCLQAATATCLQIPMVEVPDARIDERIEAGENPERLDTDSWDEFCEWAASRGYSVVVHATLPTHLRRWIGVCALDGLFRSHCLVMEYDRIRFDPAAASCSGRARLREFGQAEITYGISFNEQEEA